MGRLLEFWLDGQLNENMEGMCWLDRLNHRFMKAYMDGLLDSWLDAPVDACMYGLLESWLDCFEGCLDERLDGLD
ncbi:hypothetical protein DPMN_066200 [Dreissena polymorpha]|uniref:Uncharacterized protein n=1 Tax=Dreissena polymorpha TaxID=45954 RepID=A0A9D3YXD5_DREPO|nr:hypothetical protein DPMN_066200 [Dreissena polymorpha]